MEYDVHHMFSKFIKITKTFFLCLTGDVARSCGQGVIFLDLEAFFPPLMVQHHWVKNGYATSFICNSKKQSYLPISFHMACVFLVIYLLLILFLYIKHNLLQLLISIYKAIRVQGDFILPSSMRLVFS